MSDLVDRDLKETLARLVTERSDDVGVDPVSAVERRIVHRRRHRRQFIAGVAAICVVVVASGVLLTRRDGSHSQKVGVVSVPPTVSPLVVTDPSGTQSLPPPPFSGRSGVALVWTGNEIVLWGGTTHGGDTGPGSNDGAALDPATGEWRVLPASPIATTDGLSFGTMTPAGVLVTRGRAAALWDPRSNQWTPLPDAPDTVLDLHTIGNVVVSHSASARLDVAARQWSDLPDPPVFLDRPATVATDRELIVVGGNGSAFNSTGAMAYDPEHNQWRVLPDPPEDVHAEALSADWDGSRVVVVNYDMRAETYDPVTNVWTDLPSVPARFYEWYPLLRSSGNASAAFMAQAFVVLTPDDKWVPLPYRAIHFGAITSTGGGTIVAWDGDTLMAADLNRVVESPPRLQVGVGSVGLPEGYQVGDTSFEPGSPDVVETVRVVLEHGEDTCTVASGYLGIETGPPDGNTETLTNDGKPTVWSHDPSKDAWSTNATTSDVFTIECDSDGVARTLAESASFVFPN